MRKWRSLAIDAGMEFFRASRAHRLVERYTRGAGVILTFHHVRPRLEQSFEPNQPLEITPEFLDATLRRLRERGFEIVSLDAALARLRGHEHREAPFAVLTFDDGYRDLQTFALPILERHRAPFVAYVTAGFADGSARLWWVELEEAIRRLLRLDIVVGGQAYACSIGDAHEKKRAFFDLYWRLRACGEDELLRVTTALAAQAKIETASLTHASCLGWSELRDLARRDLATIGAHSLTHPRLSKLDDARAMSEIAESRRRIEQELGAPVAHFCYPIGDPDSAGRREFELVRMLGFASATTTRPGMIFPQHRDHLFALPRLSINGRHQTRDALDVLLSGAPFALMNRGRRVQAA